jgi:hypothetical protein
MKGKDREIERKSNVCVRDYRCVYIQVCVQACFNVGVFAETTDEQ